MALDEAVFEHFGHHALVEAGRVQVGRLFGLQELGVKRRGCDQITQTQAGGQDFGKRAQIHAAFRMARAERGRGRRVKPQVAVGVVFDDRQARLDSHLGHGGAALFGHGAARGVLEVGQQIDKAGFVGSGAHFGTQVVRIHAMVVAVHTHGHRLHGGEGLQCAQVGGGLDQDAAARVDQDLGDQVQALLASGGDQHLVGADVHALLEQVLSHPFAQWRIAFAGGVLQSGFAVISEHALAGFAHGVDRESLG